MTELVIIFDSISEQKNLAFGSNKRDTEMFHSF